MKETFMPESLMKERFPEIILEQPEIVELKDDLYKKNNVRVYVLRLDKVHPVISGNKLFKLCYFLADTKKSKHKKIITFGGAYSNHLAATAFACKAMDFKCIGIIRGEQPEIHSPTLLFCKENGMQLEFISRKSYKEKDEKGFAGELENKYGEHVLIPEGGFSIKGKEGAALINEFLCGKNYTFVCLPVGTATTFAGIMERNDNESEIIGFSVLKGFRDIEERLFTLHVNKAKKYTLIEDYHFGGYAKKTNELISFMNNFYEQHKIPLDFVYTGKMMFRVNDLINKKYFSPGSQILCIHTGGLQGNNSLPEGTLVY
ncbi:MAG TPA: pyridoxal-phosphate dependent enzyme [Hanamia sp.]|nr:pyridoxal-phosphate dependent enzyme [Hanamia sp.]